MTLDPAMDGMGDVTVTLRPADETTLGYVEALLDANDLPSGDVREKPEVFFVASRDGGDGAGDERVGVGGIETVSGATEVVGRVETVDGTDGSAGTTESPGLLRSVVVEQSVRGNGYGTALCAALERRARAEGVETLYLLTTTADDFFAARGFTEIERSDAPAGIRRTTEFADLCPATATCMKKRL
jgi:amino-acid N-acetyltransferase